MTEKETCEGCGAEYEKGSLARDQNGDASQLRCPTCLKPDEKPKKKTRKRKETPMPAAAVPVQGLLPVTKELIFSNPEIPLNLEELAKDAEAWARECGLPKVTVQPAVKENFPKRGYGYTFQIMEMGGKDRKATARYTSHGKRNFWTIDGMVTG